MGEKEVGCKVKIARMNSRFNEDPDSSSLHIVQLQTGLIKAPMPIDKSLIWYIFYLQNRVFCEHYPHKLHNKITL